MTERCLDEATYDELRDAVRELIVSVGGLEKAAAMTRVSKSTLASYYDRQAALFMPIDIVADLESGTDNPIVSRRLARLKNVFICELPDTEDDEVLSQLAEVADRVGQVFRESSTALESPDKLTAEEYGCLRDAIYECFQSLLALEDGLIKARGVPDEADD